MSFKKTLWSDRIEEKLQELPQLRSVVNEDFEGEARFNETVKVYTYNQTAPIQDYDRRTPIDVTSLVPEEVSLVIDQSKAFFIRTDRVDELQANTGMMNKFLSNQLVEMADVIDDSIFANKAAFTTNIDHSATKLDPSNIISIIEDLDVAFNDEKVSKDRFIYVDTKTMSILRLSEQLNVVPTMHEGAIGAKEVYKVGNFEIIESTKVQGNGTTLELVAGSKGDAINFVGALESIEEQTIPGLTGTAYLAVVVWGSKVFNGAKGGILTVKDYSAA